MVDSLFIMLKVIPLALPVIWVAGAVIFYFRKERRAVKPGMFEVPLTVLIPCHNEELTIRRTIESLDLIEHRPLEVIAIDDGSRDQTLKVLHRLAATRDYMRVISLQQNRGKAAALSIGLLSSVSPYILCLDADSEIQGEAIPWMLRNMLSDPRLGAVTGNPIVKNRGTLIGRLQVGEFSTIIGLIKRYQQTLGKLFTVSGVFVLFRREALLDVGMWDTDTLTEDIGISWKLQVRGWRLAYEPRAICQVLMPDTLNGLWRQRLRWAQGGFEVVSRHALWCLRHGDWGFKAILLEYVLAVAWTLALPPALIALYFFAPAPESAGPPDLAWAWSSAICITALASFGQFAAGLWLHGRYEKATGHMAYWAIWYPFVYWILNSLALLVAIPRTLFSQRQKFSTWISPDRGGLTQSVGRPV